LQNLTLPPVKRGLVQLRMPCSKVKNVLMVPLVGLMEKGSFATLRSVEMELPLTLSNWPLRM
jgi:ABC-type enterochelin transport system permease subunit